VGGRIQEVMRSTLLLFFLFPLLSSGSDNHTNRPTKAALRKERRELLLQQQQKKESDRESKTNKNCSRQHNKRKFAIWRSSRRRQNHITRKAYRMGILASLAYHNFDTKDNETNSWEFSLTDDPLPIQYLLEESDNRSFSTKTTGKKKERSLVHTIVAGVIARLQVSKCQIHYKVAQMLQLGVSDLKLYESPNRVLSYKKQCKHKILKQHGKGKRYTVEWYFSDWHEKNSVKAWHDTDLIIATSGKAEIVLSFAGTASAADAVTNVQTLEPVNHSRLFTDTNSTSSIKGNIHRGFLNAYSRVSRGRIKQLNKNGHNIKSNSLKTIDRLFTQCITQQNSRKQSKSTAVAVIPTNSTEKEKRKLEKKLKQYNSQVCYSREHKLMDILRNVTTTALKSGKTVHVVGHSLGGALATVHALDIIMNEPDVPIKKLHLYTFGSPEVADSLFFQSAGQHSRRLRYFLSDSSRFHRYVTQSTKTCATDMVASITSTSLNRRGFKRIGGVRGTVLHTIEPSLIPYNISGGELHELRTYLRGISSKLNTNFPLKLRRWLGESVLEEGIVEA